MNLLRVQYSYAEPWRASRFAFHNVKLWLATRSIKAATEIEDEPTRSPLFRRRDGSGLDSESLAVSPRFMGHTLPSTSRLGAAWWLKSFFQLDQIAESPIGIEA